MQSQIVLILGTMLVLVGVAAGCQNPCPPLWTGFEGRCFRLFHQIVSFTEAEEACKQFKLIDCNGTVFTTGHLTSIHSDSQQKFMKALVISSLSEEINEPGEWDPQVFIGMVVGSSNSDQSWTDGSPVNYHHAWYSGEPNEAPNSHGVIAAGSLSSGLWADVPDSTRMRYICQLPCSEFSLPDYL